MINTKNVKSGDYIWCIEDYVDGDYGYSVYLYMAECANYIICSAKYTKAEDFEEQLKIMENESVEEDGVNVYIFRQPYCFETKNELVTALKRLKCCKVD